MSYLLRIPTIGYIFVCVLFQSILILSNHIVIFPELYILPWTTSFGNIPYIDFIDHHGFLLYILLAPFSHDKSLILTQLFFILIQTLNLVLLFFILNTIVKKLFAFYYSIIFICFSFFLVENTLWYEVCILTCLLGMYILSLHKQVRGKGILIGVLAALASFIKPTASIFLIPYITTTYRKYVFIPFMSLWFIILSFYTFHGGLHDLFFGLIGYNSYLIQHYEKTPFSQQKFWIILIVLLFIQLFLTNKQTNKQINKRLLLLTGSLVLCSLVFVGMGYTKAHMYPFITFYVLLSALLWVNTKKRYKPFSSLIVGILLLISSFQAIRIQHSFVSKPYKTSLEIVSFIMNQPIQNVDNNNIFILSQHTQDYYQYYLLSPYPNTQFPITFPHIEQAIANYPEKIIEELKQQQISYVLVSRDMKRIGSQQFQKIFQYIEDNYTQVFSTKDSILYKRNN